MKTLYDLLGALPDDDADDIRAAFRKAVKSSHPDINPGDPEAAIKFRQIVRANEILVDEDQRAVYDHLLDLARIEQEAASKQAVAAAIHKVASGTMALAGISVVAIGGYLVYMQLSVSSVEPWAEAIRQASHSVAQVLARPSFAVAHAPPAAKPPVSTEVADARLSVPSPAPDTRDPASDAPPETAGPASAPAAAGDPAWDDRGDGSTNAIAYLDLAPKYPAPHIETAITPFGFAKSNAASAGVAPGGSAQNNNARNSNAQNSMTQTAPVLNNAAAPKHVEKNVAAAPGPAAKSSRMLPPHAEIPMMPEPRPRLTAVQDLSRQESPGSSLMR